MNPHFTGVIVFTFSISIVSAFGMTMLLVQASLPSSGYGFGGKKGGFGFAELIPLLVRFTRHLCCSLLSLLPVRGGIREDGVDRIRSGLPYSASKSLVGRELDCPVWPTRLLSSANPLIWLPSRALPSLPKVFDCSATLVRSSELSIENPDSNDASAPPQLGTDLFTGPA
ncbi:hypothetical protein U1Q18_046650 [Sarracenia purpurea var. burkii]